MNETARRAWAVAVTLSQEIDAMSAEASTAPPDDHPPGLGALLDDHGEALAADHAMGVAVDLLLARRATVLDRRFYDRMATGVTRTVSARRADQPALATLRRQLARVADGADDQSAQAARELRSRLEAIAAGRYPDTGVDARRIAEWMHRSRVDRDVAQAGLLAAFERGATSAGDRADDRADDRAGERVPAMLGSGGNGMAALLELIEDELERRWRAEDAATR